MTKLSKEEIEAKAAELSKVHKCEVTPIVFTDTKTDEQIVGYLKEVDNYNVLLPAVDKFLSGSMTEGAEIILNYSLIREESSPRILSDDTKDVKIKVGAVMACIPLLKFYSNEYQKK